MQRVERRRTKKNRYLFPSDKAELILVSFSFAWFSYRAFEALQSGIHQFYLLYEVITNFKCTAKVTLTWNFQSTQFICLNVKKRERN